ncbi:regulator of g-protein signaling 12 [Gigaspora margarita]|uniref:Regulator of g-protein signaling 12 n=1 Tax=Gigaspora margarita TaxID=4874 RepID=A0A8H3X501_GIGMA|nr:regulator of g-protein signaling 12 [Gigaspora margarita]
MDSQNLSDDFALPYSTNLATESYNTASLRTARRHVIAHTDNFSLPGTITNHEINPLSSVSSHFTTNERIHSVYNNSRKPSNTSLASTFTQEVSTLNSDTPLIDSSNSEYTVHDNSPLISPSRSTRQFTHIHRKRLSRTMQHISSFIKITVNISSTISFPVTIEKTFTVERLARQIEAEYAFKYGDIEGCLHEPLEVGLLYDVSMVALRFRDLVADVLEHGDVVNVLNIYEDFNRSSNDLEHNEVLDFEFQDFDLENNFVLDNNKENRSNAPLQVNLSDEIRKDITWPLDDDCIIERNMFDEAQEAVYQLMKGHSFARFEISPEWEECEKIKLNDPKEYEDREMTEPLE